MVYARKSEREEIRELKAAQRDPADLAQRVAEYQAYLEKKRAGRLPMYERISK
jgi:hypothetical protein